MAVGGCCYIVKFEFRTSLRDITVDVWAIERRFTWVELGGEWLVLLLLSSTWFMFVLVKNVHWTCCLRPNKSFLVALELNESCTLTRLSFNLKFFWNNFLINSILFNTFIMYIFFSLLDKWVKLNFIKHLLWNF